MDEAFLTLLAKKDFEYITVKEICEVAEVNRSTLYLHYETMSDFHYMQSQQSASKKQHKQSIRLWIARDLRE